MTTLAFQAGTRRTKRRAAVLRVQARRNRSGKPRLVTQWVTVAEAAKMLGVSTSTVRNRIKSGLLKADNSGSRGSRNTLVQVTM